MEEELTDKEKAQMRRLVSLQKVTLGIVAKWWRPFAAMFLVLTVVFAVFLVRKASRSVQRFTAETRLLYNPKHIDKVESPNDKQLMSILERKSLKRRVGDEVDMALEERECLSQDMEIIQERRPTNLYTLRAASRSWQGAVKKANAYAEILINEYVEYRKKDLESLRQSLVSRREGLVEQLAEIETAESTLMTKTGALPPQDALLSLNALVSDQRRNDSALGVDVANEELKKRKLEQLVGVGGKAVVANAQAIRRRADAIAAIDKDLALLREKYTDINPKVVGKLDEREKLATEMKSFLKSKGVPSIDLAGLDQVEKAAGELADVMTRLEALAEKRRAVQQEIKDNEKKAASLVALIPEYEHLQTSRTDISMSIRSFDEQLNDITYLQGVLRNDLRQIERAGGAGDKGPFGPKQIVLTFGGAVFCCGGLLFAVVCLELLFGKVRGGREVAAYDGIDFLGSLPKPGVLPADEDHEVMGVIAMKLLLANKESRVVLACRLPGVKMRDDFIEAFDFTETMSGMSGFLLDIVSSSSFTHPDDAEQMIGVVKKGNKGWFPVANRFVMAPTELQMLQADIAELSKSFDGLFLRMDGGVRIGGTFFDQLLGVCDSVLIIVGAGTTSRSAFSYVRRHLSAAGKPIKAIVTGAGAKTVEKEMEARV